MPGKLYLAPEGTPKEAVIREENCVGATSGKVELTVRENVYEVRDADGNKVCDLRYGARMEIKGRLASLSGAAIEALGGASRGAYGRYEVGEAPTARRFTLCLVCPIHGANEDFTLYLGAAARGQSKICFDWSGGDGVDFSVVSESRYGNTSATLTFGERSAL